MAAKNRINLLPQEEFEESTFGRILKWLLSSFRLIVVLTEVVVIGGFLSRFWLDARNTDLDELIKQKSALILADRDFEKEFKNTQDRIRVFAELSGKGSTNNLISKVGNLLPPDVRLDSISVVKDEINVSGESSSELSIYQFMTNLGADEDFSEVNLSSVTSSPESLGSLIFTLSLKKKG